MEGQVCLNHECEAKKSTKMMTNYFTLKKKISQAILLL